jgi:hypothetical protein
MSAAVITVWAGLAAIGGLVALYRWAFSDSDETFRDYSQPDEDAIKRRIALNARREGE